MHEDQERAEARDVAAVEAVLERVATRYEVVAAARPADRPRVSLAAWFCACVAWSDTPTWLVHTTDEGLAWCHLDQGIDSDRVVDAELTTGAHVAPADVLAWLASGIVPADVDDPEIATALRRAMLR